jgi:hypothetical protein
VDGQLQKRQIEEVENETEVIAYQNDSIQKNITKRKRDLFILLTSSSS